MYFTKKRVRAAKSKLNERVSELLGMTHEGLLGEMNKSFPGMKLTADVFEDREMIRMCLVWAIENLFPSHYLD